MTASSDTLFRPFPFGQMTLANRIVMAPMTRNRSPGGVPTDEVVAYYRRRAQGGVGLIITEGTLVGHKAASGYPNVPIFDGEESLAGWGRVLEAVHGAGGVIIPQIWHVGSVRQSGMGPDRSVPGYGPSPIAHPNYKGKGEVPHEMSQADIDEVIAAFARAAGNALRLGFDGVEIHGAHGYLLDQFFWDQTNRRTDGYGGSLEDRTRFAAELIAAVREAVGPGFPVVLRFSQWKMGDYKAKLAQNPEELGRLLAPLSRAGVDIFHASTRRFWEPEFEGSDLNLAGWTKKLTGKPTITVGSVGLDSDFISSFAGKASGPADLENLLARLGREEFDLVAVGRGLIAEPAWASKVRAGDLAGLTPFSPAALGRLE